MGKTDGNKLVAPCGLYCGACIDYLVHRSCHGCGCDCGGCEASSHRESCDIYRCCVVRKGHETCGSCDEFPCSKLIQFCYNPVWLHHLPVIENLRRQKARGAEKWLEEQKEVWSDEWYLQRWLWLQRECEKRLKQSWEESESMGSKKS